MIAHESFEDREVAALLNADFIPVKVDKEERPDVDAVYMDAVELSTGSGGWPMTLLLTPAGEPFFAATYLPKESKGGRLGLKGLLRNASEGWKRDRQSVLKSARSFTQQLERLADRPTREAEPTEGLCRRAVGEYAAAYDPKWGGFGGAPKFPAAHNLLFLLEHARRTGDADALSMATGTLEAMYRGGIFDHIGGGFCRYSVDRQWLTPHFEKMLYDNALLLWAYAQAWQIARKPLYRFVAQRTADYVLREMTSPDGAFFCSQDADSQGKEGAFYVFTPEEIHQQLGQEDGALFCRRYGVAPGGNFEGKSILHLMDQPDDDREPEGMGALRERLYEYRQSRMPLGLDDKVLTSWNALMINALCVAAQALDRPDYLTAAQKAERFLGERLTAADGGLLLRYRDQKANGVGVLADYAYLALALTTLHEATGERAYVERAERVAGLLLERFGSDSGLYLYAQPGERLITRPKETWDGAMPSGNSCAALAMLRLARHTDDPRWKTQAEKQLRFLAGVAEKYPMGHGFALMAIEESLRG